VKGPRARLSAWAIFIALGAGIVPAVQPVGKAYAQNLGQRSVGHQGSDADQRIPQGKNREGLGKVDQ